MRQTSITINIIGGTEENKALVLERITAEIFEGFTEGYDSYQDDNQKPMCYNYRVVNK